jgi:hypothetical protein
MKNLFNRCLTRAASLAILASLLPAASKAADHNDPNSINSIFSDITADPADLYDLFGWPSDDVSGGEKVIVALTFASMPATGVFDTDMLYRILLAPTPRVSTGLKDDDNLNAMLKYFQALEKKYVGLQPSEIRVTVDKNQRATIAFSLFPERQGSTFKKEDVELNKVTNIDTPNGFVIKAYVGGRDDAFFNDLPGFFRSINYAPQFYLVPEAKTDARETKIPKTLLELEGNKLFNFDPAFPEHGQGKKVPLPSGPLTWSGTKFLKDEKGNFRFVYSGKDAQAGRNINAIILEIPLAFITASPAHDRVVNAWGESWVLKASGKIAQIKADRPPLVRPFFLERPWLLPAVVIVLGVLFLFWAVRVVLRRRASQDARSTGRKTWFKPVAWTVLGLATVLIGLTVGCILTKVANKKPVLVLSQAELDEQLRQFKLIDTDGQPFADAALNERESDKQLGAFNFSLALPLVTRLAHLGWGFGPSIEALGIHSSFDCSNAPVSVYKTYSSALAAFPRSRKVLFQKLNMPDDTWKKRPEMDIPLKRSLEIFVPNVCPIDMDTTGTWPYGRRPEDQVATRFLSLFLDMEQQVAGKKCNIETLNDPALWASAHIEPKTPPNPLKNDKEFLKEFPYLADPWP